MTRVEEDYKLYVDTNTKPSEWSIVTPDHIELVERALDPDFNIPHYYCVPEGYTRVQVQKLNRCNRSATPIKYEWQIKCESKKLYTIVGSECWKRYNPKYDKMSGTPESIVVYEDLKYDFLKYRKQIMSDYYQLWKSNSIGDVGQAYDFSTYMRTLDWDTYHSDIKKMLYHLSHSYNLKQKIPDSIKKNIGKLTDKRLRGYFN